MKSRQIPNKHFLQFLRKFKSDLDLFQLGVSILGSGPLLNHGIFGIDIIFKSIKIEFTKQTAKCFLPDNVSAMLLYLSIFHRGQQYFLPGEDG